MPYEQTRTARDLPPKTLSAGPGHATYRVWPKTCDPIEMMMNRFMMPGIAFAAFLTLGAGVAGAEDWTLAGHLVTLTETSDEGFKLSVDGKVMLETWLLFEPQTLDLPGAVAFYGISSAGGNGCEGAPFVLYLPEGAPARLDGPIDTCSYLEAVIADDMIRWTSPKIPGRMTVTWGWSAENGIIESPPVAFAPGDGRGWEALPELVDAHPADALLLEPVYNALKAGLGAEWDDFAGPIGELGSGGLIGPDYYGEACLKFECDASFAGLWLEAESQKVFAYWKSFDSSEVHLFPADRNQWPRGAQDKLAERGL